MSVNKVILIGRLGQDPETRTLQTGNRITSFSLATGEKWTDKNGDKQESTDWHNVEAWDKLADICSQYLKKGSEVYLEGKLKTDSWEQDGVKKYRTKVVARSLQMLGGKPQEAGGGWGGAKVPDPVKAEPRPEPIAPPVMDDDLPF
jgi:single-strand DNA-binding protein